MHPCAQFQESLSFPGGPAIRIAPAIALDAQHPIFCIKIKIGPQAGSIFRIRFFLAICNPCNCGALHIYFHSLHPSNNSIMIPFITNAAHGSAIPLPHILYNAVSLYGSFSHLIICDLFRLFFGSPVSRLCSSKIASQ